MATKGHWGSGRTYTNTQRVGGAWGALKQDVKNFIYQSKNDNYSYR